MGLFVFGDTGRFREGLRDLLIDIVGLVFPLLHQLQGEGESEDPTQGFKPSDAKVVHFRFRLGVSLPKVAMPFLFIGNPL